MKDILKNINNTNVSIKQIADYFTEQGKIEKEKNATRLKMIEDEIKRATKGKNIVVSNASK